MWHRLSLFSGGTRPKFYLGKFHCRSTFGAMGSLLLWLIAFPEPLRNPCPEDTSCCGNLWPSPFSPRWAPNSLLWLRVLEPCPALPGSCPEKKFTQGCQNCWLCSLTVYKCVMNERTCPVLFLHLLIQKGNIRKETPQSIPTKPKYRRIDF